MSDTVTDVVTFWSLDFEPEIPCDGYRHAEGVFGHVPGQIASWICKCPKCEYVLPLCNGAKEWVLTEQPPSSLIQCPSCRRAYFLGLVVWTQIRAVS